jgi:hypothetical protein
MTRDRIAVLRREQETLRAFAAEADPPALLLLADEESLSIRGNEAGLIRFAMELLEVSTGGELSPEASEWIDAAWLPLESIVLDPAPKFEATKPTFRANMVGYAVMATIVIFLTAGAITSINWLLHAIHLHH